tara:strand:- start:124 stop:420 length:297 start_codon:yes stop_codon:yes gene_type:complete
MKTKKTIKINDTELPKWFKGVVYKEGDLVSNPFTGNQAILTPNELAMYDFIKGAEYTISVTYNDDILHPDVARLSNEMRKALDWFRKANARAYLILLD